MSDRIEIKVGGKKLTPDKFLEAAKQFFALIEGVTRNVTGKSIKWVVEVDKGSAILRMRDENPSFESQNAIDTVCQGIRGLRAGARTMPRGFTEKEVRASKALAALIDGDDVQTVSIQNGSAPEDLPQSVIATADAILEGSSHIAFGSIEGKIIQMSARHGFSCTIYDPLERREIACYLQKEDVQSEAVKGFAKRVLAGGLIHYAKEGYPVSVTADTIRIFPPDSELPIIEEIQGIYRLYK